MNERPTLNVAEDLVRKLKSGEIDSCAVAFISTDGNARHITAYDKGCEGLMGLLVRSLHEMAETRNNAALMKGVTKQ